MRNRLWLLAVGIVTAATGASLMASLLGLTLGKPTTSLVNPSTINFDASTHILSVATTPSVERFADGNNSLFAASPAPSLAINILLKPDGTIDPAGVAGNNLVLLGRVQDGATVFDSSVGGPLLTGNVTAFGYQDGGSGFSDAFDFRFTVTGGQLASYFYTKDIGVSIVSDNGNTFAGVFTANFTGNAKGTLGTVPMVTSCTGSIGDFVWHDHTDLNGVANGLQDVNEEGIDGVTVVLTKPDNTTESTTTGIGPGGIHGYYQFSGLCKGTYVVTVTTPDGYSETISKVDGGSHPDTDSNGSPETVVLPVDNSTDQTIDFGFVTPCTSKIGDFVWDDENGNGIQDAGELGINGVTVNLLDQNGNIFKTTVTGSSPVDGSPGYYSFDGLCAGTYKVQAVKPQSFTGEFSPQYQGTDTGKDSNVGVNGITDDITVPPNTTDLTIDIGLVPPATCSSTLGDFVWNDANQNGIQDAGELGIDGATVELLVNGLVVGSTTTTTHNGLAGYYQFPGLSCAESYQVRVTTPGAYPRISPALQGGNTNLDSNGVVSQDGLHSIAAPVTLTAAGDQSIDFGFYACSGTIGDFVWNDLNDNGIQDAGEPGIPNVTLALQDGNGNALGTTALTDANGYYLFGGLCKGDYKVVVQSGVPAGMNPSPSLQGGDTSKDSNGSPAPVTLPNDNSIDLTIDFGYFAPPPPNPCVDIVKYTSVSGTEYDSNDPDGYTVGEVPPHVAPGTPIGWTYHVTNCGNVPIAKADVHVTDNAPGVSPAYEKELTGNGDTIFDPGEVWQYSASGTALDLSQPLPAGTPQMDNVCTDGGFLPPTTAYFNTGTVTIPGASDRDPASYCTNRTPDEPSPCPAGSFDAHINANGDLVMVFDQFPAPNDNSYGVNAVGWSHGHRFSDLTQSDKAGFQLTLASTGAIRLSFNIDYLTATTPTLQFPSGYKSYGPFGGDGGIVTNSSPVALTNDPNKITWDTSLSRDLNSTGYFQLSGTAAVQVIGKPATAGCTAAQAAAATCVVLTTDSPKTVNTTDNYTLVTPTPFVNGMNFPGGAYPENGRVVTGWDFHDTYFVTLKKAYLSSIGLDTAKFTDDPTVTAPGYWTAGPNLAALHNSPAKPCPTPTVSGCPTRGLIQFGAKEVKITLTAPTNADAIMTGLTLTWPTSNGKLVKVLLDGDVVYDNPDLLPPSATLTLAQLVADVKKRTIAKGTSDVLHLQFEKNVDTVTDHYSGTVSFGTTCTVTILP